MNSNWKRIFNIIQKPERLIIGLMSGTSMDGLDIALCGVTGSGTETRVRLIEFKTMPYSNEFKAEIKAIFSRRDADLQMVCLMNEKVALLHADMILEVIALWGREPKDIDVIASHGQTIFHAPHSLHGLANYPNATLQIGDGDHIAVKTGIVTIADFRQKHIAAGGEGAPLAVYGDYLLFSKKDEDRIMLNIGGIANFTYLPGDNDAAKVFSTDVGPGNTLMDQFVQKYYKGLYYDENASIATSGVVNEQLLKALMQSEFLEADFPKTTGPELFNLEYLAAAQNRSNTLLINKEDVMATLCRFSAQVIVNAIEKCFGKNKTPSIYISGGGMHNPLLLQQLKTQLNNASFHSTDALEINPDAKEAVLFAILANETLVGHKIDFGDRAGVPSVQMGKVCLP
ncbi:MAG: anhydro-N-acetylmuramic acid kinase [Candidatus Pedobacter colombiensis]|uniref:Anhydro-N-acetylmuramic acid kinase n=1 Tax=Candidatus Pedobacter colombiensis TaxID=3121371 RepID=A0AAJ5W9D9_9SPHI|nr:anhydro-N-acetylmuramic acid kinase [Pedobacter sp.]WEK19510.1 MAG: anhydro-N-acetylmuramic acid kinase [Pedobacter sp.]